LAPEAAAPVSLAALILPLVTTIAIVLLIFLVVGHDAAAEVLVKSVAIATFAGKFAVLLDTPDGFLKTPYHMAVMITYMDLLFGFICVFNVGVLFRIRGFGKKLQDLQGFCRLMLRRNPWMRKATFVGTVAFVMFPLSGTGAIGGSLFSQILGMSRIRALFAILCGAVIGSFGLAYLADTVLPEDVQDSWLFKLGGLLFILIIVWILTKLYKRIDPEAIKDEQ
jgi:uncharacterized membrane protein